MNKLQKFIAKLFKIETEVVYDIKTIGMVVKPGEVQLLDDKLYIENRGPRDIYIGFSNEHRRY